MVPSLTRRQVTSKTVSRKVEMLYTINKTNLQWSPPISKFSLWITIYRETQTWAPACILPLMRKHSAVGFLQSALWTWGKKIWLQRALDPTCQCNEMKQGWRSKNRNRQRQQRTLRDSTTEGNRFARFKSVGGVERRISGIGYSSEWRVCGKNQSWDAQTGHHGFELKCRTLTRFSRDQWTQACAGLSGFVNAGGGTFDFEMRVSYPKVPCWR